MKTCVRLLTIVSLALGISLVEARTDAQVAVTSVTTTVSGGVKISEFQQAVSSYFRVPTRDVAQVSDRQVRDDEIPVVLFIAQRASVAPGTVVDLRQRGFSWWDISTRYRLGAEAYYVRVAGNPAAPYDRAYSYYQRPRNQWNTIVLADADIVNLVHLRFLTEHYHVSPQKVIELRGRSGDFVAVQREVSGRGGL